MPGAHAHTKLPHRSIWWRVTYAALAAVVAAAVVVTLVHTTGTKVSATTPASMPTASLTASKRPLNVVSVSPADGAAAVPSDATLTVQFSEPLSAQSPMPTLTPPVAGSWQQVTPTTLAFAPSAPLVPSTTETLNVPGGAGGIESAGGIVLGQGTTVHFTVAAGSTLRLQQLLAQLGYLPVGFTAAGPLTAPQELAQPQEGTFTWRFLEPSSLTSLWTPGTWNAITKGAVMTFENQHDMRADGEPGPAVWGQLLASAEAGTGDPAAYNYVYVSETLPETTTVYSNGADIYSTLANTGAASVPTAQGTFPVFEHLTSTTMSGTNPDGTKYVDPGIPWVSYFNGGDALHGYVRAAYGFPQSDGCVEMPPANAGVVFPYTPIGTLVTVAA
ncbi:MAG: Ig-like domain-containing protein [Acidimicrobiales bacterium]|jgi:hypothetical protein